MRYLIKAQRTGGMTETWQVDGNGYMVCVALRSIPVYREVVCVALGAHGPILDNSGFLAVRYWRF